MALDALMTRSILVNSAATFNPTGPLQVGGSAVDEIDLYIGNKGIHSRPLAAVAFIPGPISGTTPTLDASLESATDVAFTTPTTRVSAKRITNTTGRNGDGTGKYFLFWVIGIPERYVRFKLVAGGTTPNFGTVTCALLDADDDSLLS